VAKIAAPGPGALDHAPGPGPGALDLDHAAGIKPFAITNEQLTRSKIIHIS